MNNDKQRRKAAAEFVKKWTGRGSEKSEMEVFWLSLLRDIFSIECPEDYIEFQMSVEDDHTKFADAYIATTRVLIEHKSAGIDLNGNTGRGNGLSITPYQQAKQYNDALPYSKKARWIVTCNFTTFQIYDMELPNKRPEVLQLADLEKEYHRLAFLIDNQSDDIKKEIEVSVKAGEIIGKIYDSLLQEPPASLSAEEYLHALNIFCVQLVFCFYAEDAGIFARNQFYDYLKPYNSDDFRRALITLFDVLNTPQQQRDPFLEPKLAAFPYVNGGLFSAFRPQDENAVPAQNFMPPVNMKAKTLILDNDNHKFDWSTISPTIFGAVFESTLNPDTRRKGGMHYTSIENIHKVIDPLFLDALNNEFNEIIHKNMPNKQRLAMLGKFQDRLAGIRILDPACGSGNFLTETYLSLRHLENRVIKYLYSNHALDAFVNPIKVSINQFYGIEINDFAVTVATTALWISEAQMMAETERIIDQNIDFLPLKSYTNIHEGNALNIKWSDIVPQGIDYIIGNPPFIGARIMNERQKADLISVFGKKWKNVGNMDYVTCWYKKAADFMKQFPHVRTALVATNSICQGEQVADLWQTLFNEGIRINFAHRTFRWDSEASQKAHVHCIIVGFSLTDDEPRTIFDNGISTVVKHINAYLIDAPDVFIGSRQQPLCKVPAIGIGNQPIDGGNYLFTRDEMEAFIKKEPRSMQYFRAWYGAEEFIHRKPRYCLWLGDCTPAELQSMPHCRQRVQNVRNYRLASKRSSTLKLADTPTRFQTENMPKGDYIIIPRVSSERRRYIPMGFLSAENMASDAVHIISNASLLHFGILESHTHMAWMRAVCGRLEMRYRYSKDIVYNNFPHITPTPPVQTAIEKTAQAILDARNLYPDSSLDDLYDEVTMPEELRKAHRENDLAVMQAYGFDPQMSDQEIVAELFKMYKKLINEESKSKKK